MPKKILFFSLPSVSVDKTLTPVIDQLALKGYDVVHYNTEDFAPNTSHYFKFKSYPTVFTGHYSDKINEQTSYFDFGEILINAAASIMPYLVHEVEQEEPDVIIHSHLAVWGKLLARHCQVPNITLYTTFILDQRIMLPFFREIYDGNLQEGKHVKEAIGFLKKSKSLYKALGLRLRPDMWDVYINKGELNLSFILEAFQPERTLFGPEFHFLGYPTQKMKSIGKKELVYISMGTIVSQELQFFRSCIDLFSNKDVRVIISVGSRALLSYFGDVPDHIQLVPFVEQQKVLKEAKLFITRGGMASVHEAVYTLTPMVVIPVIPEQKMTARNIGELGIGVCIEERKATTSELQRAVDHILNNYERFTDNLSQLFSTIPETQATVKACQEITHYLEKNKTRAPEVLQ
ncbi:glycosyltransferase [Fulvivirga sp. M361]|uniref:nucleotide disphospho-sugar-binding domain-containing protein n=1 Tax=Fulvivirga sp. M361 TaxID=2594266 RepID=UPI001623192E|nr:glycosyltransferase [Fulvivirga sp. M361]